MLVWKDHQNIKEEAGYRGAYGIRLWGAFTFYITLFLNRLHF